MYKMVMSLLKKIGYLAAAFVVFNSCNADDRAGLSDTEDRGTIYISADESFKPVIDSQIQVYESLHPGTKIIAQYKPEAECLRDFAVDSIRMVIATRGYSKNEEDFLLDSMKVQPSKLTVAYDAIAVIVNPQSTDSLFTMNEIRNIVTGKATRNLTPVFDGVRATSTVRFMIDSVLKGGSLGSNVVAAQNSEGVIDYVSKNKNTIGFIGVSWVGNKEDSTQLTYLEKVKVAQLQSTGDSSKYVTPAQYNIYYRRYPMVRDWIYTIKENHQGLGHGFANFMAGQRGQLIFRRAYLMPAQMQFNVRSANLRE